MLDLFRAAPSEARRENLAAYKAFLDRRNGVLDLEKRQLSRREERMTRFERPLERIRDLDRETFAKQYEAFDPSVEVSPETALLLALVKLNAAEAYGVNTCYEMVLRRALKQGDEIELMVLVEETYHTRILLSTALSYGIDLKTAYRPPAGLRALIAAIGKSPTGLSRPLTMAAEVLGVLMLANMLDKTRAILENDPELRDSVEERICEILTDEIGHVSYNRTLLGPMGMAQARAYLPLIAIGLSGAFPEMQFLGTQAAGSGDDVRALLAGKRVPEHVERAAFLC